MAIEHERSGARGRLLVADDHAGLLKSMVAALRQAGFETVGAKSGEQALALIEDRPFDVLIADIDMPGNEQLELLSAARTAAADIDVILMTNQPKLSTAVGALRERANDYLTKPIAPEALVLSVDRAMRERRSRRAPTDPLANLEPEDLARLSLREREIARMLALGDSAKDVASKLELSPNTVRNHMKSVFAKLRIHSQVELLVLLRRPLK